MAKVNELAKKIINDLPLQSVCTYPYGGAETCTENRDHWDPEACSLLLVDLA